jgi:hypothetical protein
MHGYDKGTDHCCLFDRGLKPHGMSEVHQQPRILGGNEVTLPLLLQLTAGLM